MTITVRSIRNGVAVRLTGAHARRLTGLLADLVDSAEPVAAASSNPADRPPSETAPATAEVTHEVTGEGKQ
ncbi:hypothetical protein G8A07_15615 [Roseateles sp. DAIF2]|uniref:hypothetical protein n=1 Tax=Roseateles sp. DAIF2 TaxID=2714952 RepID=UPI0018A3013F|nr:hypothetical protein [Roseateles sp. DAIF2]QPF74203.1 hypothetical protein G8A07_15615 [Roseateles sp. DAIF2]